MCDLATDVILRIGQADAPTLQRIYTREVKAPVWTEDERRLLTNAFEERAQRLNAEAIGLQAPRWRTT